WEFKGSKNAAYKQIGNAVPVNMARALGHSLVRLLNDIEELDDKKAEEEPIQETCSMNSRNLELETKIAELTEQLSDIKNQLADREEKLNSLKSILN
ncbi:DNA cytosine methyltransferase, partial [Vibrio parahaemolyticus]|nr:DNA cytosine methyltransferase [Vibrio parahaemolyticus]